MKLALPALLCCAWLLLPAHAAAQATVPGNGRILPNFPAVARTLAPPRPAGLGGNLPPGLGGAHPRDTRGRGDGSSARAEAAGLLAVCAPGGALSSDRAATNAGRARARALVCPG